MLNNVRIINIDNINEISFDSIEENIGENKLVNIIFHFPQYDQKLINTITGMLDKLKEHNIGYFIYIYSILTNFDDATLKNLKILEKNIKQNIFMMDVYRDDYSIDDYEKADTKLDKLIEDINSHNFSPLEKFLYIYHYAGLRQYVATDDYKSRDLISIMNNNETVCTGYANLITYLSNQVGITAFNQQIKIDRKGEIINHENNLVYIDDDKYNIHGLYYADVTWDRGYNGKNVSYAFCLITLDHIKKMNGDKITPNSDECILYRNKDFFKLLTSEKIGEPNYGRTYYDYGYQYSNLINHYNLGKQYEEIEKKYYEEIVNKDKRITDAINMVKEYVKNLPNDYYSTKFCFPYGTSLGYLIALAYFKNTEILEENIKELMEYCDSKKELDFDKGVHFYIPDIDEYFKTLSSLDKNENSSELNMLTIADHMTKIKIYQMIEKCTENLNHGSPIPFNKFKLALKNVYDALGISDSLENDIELTKEYAKKVFLDISKHTFNN